AVFGFQSLQNVLNNLISFLIGQRMVGSTQAKRESNALLTGSHLSATIDVNADVVAFIHRPEYYGFTETEDHKSTNGIAEIILAKHRNGEVTDVKMQFIKEQARFTNLTVMPQGVSQAPAGETYDNYESSPAPQAATAQPSALQNMVGSDEFAMGAPMPAAPIAPPNDEAPF
ncbi:MAG: hypothetical protein II212_06960, partial [Alistipes sp.]|nr:hypothetical protein [Alistipes sp.]